MWSIVELWLILKQNILKVSIESCFPLVNFTEQRSRYIKYEVNGDSYGNNSIVFTWL